MIDEPIAEYLEKDDVAYAVVNHIVEVANNHGFTVDLDLWFPPLAVINLVLLNKQHDYHLNMFYDISGFVWSFCPGNLKCLPCRQYTEKGGWWELPLHDPNFLSSINDFVAQHAIDEISVELSGFSFDGQVEDKHACKLLQELFATNI